MCCLVWEYWLVSKEAKICSAATFHPARESLAAKTYLQFLFYSQLDSKTQKFYVLGAQN